MESLTKRQKYYRGTYLQSPHWRSYSQAFLLSHPLCEMPDCGERARDVHHKRYYDAAGKSVLFHEHMYDPPPTMSLCREHHAALHTALRRRKKRKTWIGALSLFLADVWDFIAGALLLK